MKLLMISGDRALAAGKRGAFYNTLEEFHKYWDRIDIITPKIPNSKFQITNIFDNVFIHPSPWPVWRQPLWIRKKGTELHQQHAFDLATVHEYAPFYNGIGARLLWNKLRVPYILEIHHITGYPKAANMKELIYRLVTRMFISTDASRAHAVRVVNRRQVGAFLKRSGVPEKKLAYIPSLYIDLDRFRPMSETKRYDLLFVGRLEKNKGLYLLLHAMVLLAGRAGAAPPKLLIVGDGPMKKELQLFIRKHELSHCVEFAGWLSSLDELARTYNRSRIFINPSFNEGGPRVVFEAMACGVPVITTRVGAAGELIEDSENGLVVSWSPHRIAEAIRRLLNDADLQRRFSQKGLELVQGFEKKAVIKNYAETLQKLLHC